RASCCRPSAGSRSTSSPFLSRRRRSCSWRGVEWPASAARHLPDRAIRAQLARRALLERREDRVDEGAVFAEGRRLARLDREHLAVLGAVDGLVDDALVLVEIDREHRAFLDHVETERRRFLLGLDVVERGLVAEAVG